MQIFGAAGDDKSGYSVSGAGDINKDGYDDFIIGAWGSAGISYLIFGKASSFVDIDLSSTTFTSSGKGFKVLIINI